MSKLQLVARSYKGIATCNKGIATSSKKLLYYVSTLKATDMQAPNAATFGSGDLRLDFRCDAEEGSQLGYCRCVASSQP